MVVVNQTGEIVLLNVQAEKQFGYRRDELLGQKVTNIIPVGFAERLIADDLRSAEDALAQQIGTGIELTALRKDGSEFPIEIMLSPLESAEGILVTAAIRNISVRKAADKHLAQMEGRYRGLLEAAPDAMVVVNQGGEIVLLNVQAEKQFGYRRDELLGQKVTNIIPNGFAERLIADDLRSAEDALAQQIGTGIELIAAAQGRQRVSDRDYAQPAGERRRNSGDGGDPQHQRAQEGGRASGGRWKAAIAGCWRRRRTRWWWLIRAARSCCSTFRRRSSSNTAAMSSSGRRSRTSFPRVSRNACSRTVFAPRKKPWRSRSEPGSSCTGGEKTAANSQSSSCSARLESAEGILVTAAIRDITTRKRAESQLLQKGARN